MSHSTGWVTVAVGGAEVDIVAEAAAVLMRHGLHPERRGHDLHLPALDLTFSPRGVEIRPVGDGRVHAVSVVRAACPGALPADLFEYQHGFGADPGEALRAGLDQWAQIDVPVLCDAARANPEDCMVLTLTLAAEDDRPERSRRALLGPTAYFAEFPSPEPGAPDSPEEHPFCPCCMLTRCMDTFMPLFRSDEALALRFFAARNVAGEAMADCRVNGQDFEDGAAALRAYVETWPQRGFEFRKQYVLFQSCG